MRFFELGPRIFHHPFAGFHFPFMAKWKLENQKWKMANSFPAVPKGPLVRGEGPERALAVICGVARMLFSSESRTIGPEIDFGRQKSFHGFRLPISRRLEAGYQGRSFWPAEDRSLRDKAEEGEGK
jgi:hypothetical protein